MAGVILGPDGNPADGSTEPTELHLNFMLMRGLLDAARKRLPAFGTTPAQRVREVVAEIQGFRYEQPEPETICFARISYDGMQP